MVKEGGVYLLCGQEDFLKEKEKKRLISLLLPTQISRFNCDSYDAKDDCKVLFDSLGNLPFLSNSRIVVVNRIDQLPEAKRIKFLSYLKSPHKTVSLILLSNKTPDNDDFVRNISFYAKTLRFSKLKNIEVKRWIIERLKEHRKSIKKEALNIFLELKGGDDLFLLENELEKLNIYTKGKFFIKKDDIIELIGKSFTKNIFDITDAIGHKDVDSALLTLNELLSNKNNDFPNIVGAIGKQLRNIWKARLLLDKGMDRAFITAQLGIHRRFINDFFKQVELFNIEELKKDIGLLVTTDVGIKSKTNKRFMLERLIIRLCSG